MYTVQVKANKQFVMKVKNVRMYLSHFVQVLYFSVMRAEIKEDQLSSMDSRARSWWYQI